MPSTCRRWSGGAALGLLLTAPLHAQTTDAWIAGRVADTAGNRVAGAQVEARNGSTGFVVRVETGGTGRFTLPQLPLGGPYTLTVRKVGYRPAAHSGLTLGLGDRLDLSFVLEPAVVRLDEVVAEGDSSLERAGRVGGNFRVDGDQLMALPTVNRNFNDLSALGPSTGPQQSVSGARWTSTDFRLDGAQARNMLRAGEYGAGPFTTSMEAIREFEVNANVYDVSQGRQGGGSISAASKAGTNQFGGSAFMFYRGSGISASTDYIGRTREQREFRSVQWGGSAGGALIRDRLHFFAAYDRQDSEYPLFIGDLQTPQDEVAAGVSQDSLNRLVSILQARYGQPADQQQLGRFERKPVANTLFTRLDWTLSPRHSLTGRYNYSDWNDPLSGGVDQPIALYESRSNFSSREHQALLSLRSTLSALAHNELQVSFSTSHRNLEPISNLPRGFVRIRSDLPDSTVGDVRVQFGGNRLAPDNSQEWQWQLLDRAYLQRGDVLWSFGFDNSLSTLHTYIAEAQSGLFEFESLALLDSLRAFRFTRSLPLVPYPTATRQQVLELGLFAQAEWQPSRHLTATLGLRWDASAFLTAAPYNALVDTALGLRTDRKPQDWMNFQPRAQVVWMPGVSGRDVVRAGVGLFTPILPYYAQHNQLLNDGLLLTDISRTGAAVPVPDYPEYREDPSTIPGLAPGQPAPPSYVNVASPDFQSPSVWKGNLGYEHRFNRWLTVGANLAWAETRNNYYYTDGNLVAQPYFRLANEGDRPVFVPAGTIDPAGRTNNRNALAVPTVSRVLVLNSIGTGRDRQAEINATITPTPQSSLFLSYTYNNSKDNSTYGCCLARTATTFTAIAGDPRDLSGSWGPSDLDFRNKVVIAGTFPPLYGFQFSVRYVGQSGRPFSAVVNGDLNGDESNANDLAFVFDPDDPSTPAEIAAAMRRVLDNPDNVAREYLRENLGRIASRNGGRAPWNSRIDVRLAKGLNLWQGQAVEFTVDVFNLANLLDSDWGGLYLLPQAISNQNPVLQRIPLLNIVGFDQATQAYRYTVNENFGVLQKQGDPWTMQLGARYRF